MQKSFECLPSDAHELQQYLAWKTDQLDKIATDQKRIATETGNHISCSKGCSACCSQHVAATLQECDAIVYWLHLHPIVREAFMARYSNWQNRLHENEAIFQRVTQTGSLAMSRPYDQQACASFMQESEKYLLLDIPCPFLDNGICAIYQVRPFVCASQIVVSPPDHCKPSRPETPVLLLGALNPDLSPPYFRGPKKNVIFSPAALMVHGIIEGGYLYLNDLPGLAGLESEAFNDPQIRALIT